MNKLLIHINRLTLAGIFLSLGGLPSCMHDEYGECEANAGDGGSEVRSYVSLSFTIPSSHTAYTPKQMRADGPTGGEQGDGEEGGQPDENSIQSAAAFLYYGDATVNSKPDIPVTLVEFNKVSQSAGGTTYFTESKPVSLRNGSYRVLVVANHPDLSWARTDATLTLGDVRDHIEENAWRQNEDGGETNFLMVSADDEARPLVLNTNPQNNPATTSVSVERVAARIDYKTLGTYDCGDRSGTIQVLGAALVNKQKEGSFLLKRVADDVKGTNQTYLGKEEVDAQGIPTNYVLDPYTAQKTADWSEASTLYDEWFGNINQNPNYWADITKPGTELNNETWRRIGYTLENIADRQYADKRYNTGVVFKARFTPKKVIGADTYTPETTFFAKGSTLFATMEAMMEHTYGKEVFDNFTAKINACADWNAVKTFTDGLQENDPSGYKQYLQKKTNEALAAQTQLTDEAKKNLQWPAYMRAECGYSRDANGDVKLDQKKGESTREVLKPFGVRTYENGICYYVWWVRHANDNDDTQTGVMEYAIVRNNVYKINVRSFYTLGGDVPGEEEPVVEVYVKDWTLLPQEDLPM